MRNHKLTPDFWDTLVNNGVVKLSKKSFESWTTAVDIAQGFSVGDGLGIILSRELKDNYLDINLAIDYLSSQESLQDLNFLTAYLGECEILAYPACTKCSMEDIECIVLYRAWYSYFLEILNRHGFKFNEVRHSGNPYFYFIFKGKNVNIFDDFDKAVKYFRVKPKDDCVK